MNKPLKQAVVQVLLARGDEQGANHPLFDGYTAMTYIEVVIADLVTLSAYESQVSAVMDEEERAAMEFYIACTPGDHPVIRGSGGFRKARWALGGKGKSGGVRVIYYFLAEPGRIFLASVYAKSRKQNLSATDLQILAKFAARIKVAAKGSQSK